MKNAKSDYDHEKIVCKKSVKHKNHKYISGLLSVSVDKQTGVSECKWKMKVLPKVNDSAKKENTKINLRNYQWFSDWLVINNMKGYFEG